jgi:hemerythrin-like metal-binding protein
MFQWDEKYSVGIQSIDSQHKEIFAYLNRLLDAMKVGQADKVIYQIVIELEKYSIIHFQKEEFFFRRFNYSGTKEHIQEHQYFIQKVASLKSELRAGKNAFSIDLLNFLKNWIENHILVVDKAYSDCFLKNGLK